MKHFKESEFRKNPDKVSPLIMKYMDSLRGMAGVPIHIHVAWSDSGHSDNSWHYRGIAVDFHFDGLTPVEQFACIRCLPDFRGIGFYPWWDYPGWHVDLRAVELFWLSPEPGEYLYSIKDLINCLIK